MRLAALGVIALLVAQLAASAYGQSASVPPPSPITFPPGLTLTTVSGQVVLGGSDLYTVAARAGQTLLVSVAAEGDVSFVVYAPDASVAKAADGRTVIRGRTLPDAGPDEHAKAWVGAISRSGNYLIAVTMDESGPVLSAYDLTVSRQ
jgi:hypothetical protein